MFIKVVSFDIATLGDPMIGIIESWLLSPLWSKGLMLNFILISFDSIEKGSPSAGADLQVVLPFENINKNQYELVRVYNITMLNW